MKLGVFTVLFSAKGLEEMLDYVTAKGVEAVELGTGGHPGDAHCRVDELLGNKQKQQEFRNKIESRGLIVSALSCHENVLHPQKKIAEAADDFLCGFYSITIPKSRNSLTTRDSGKPTTV